MPLPVHSAHVGQEVVVHYRWHPLHGQRLRRQGSEDRKAGRFVHVETAPGVVVVLAAWMLDPMACTDPIRRLHELLPWHWRSPASTAANTPPASAEHAYA
jgi:hypothetical protein